MLMANETVAQEYCTEEIPFVYRTHDNPDPEKVESLLTLLHNQGVKIQKAKEAYYYFIQFEGETTVPAELEERLRIEETVLRFLCVKQDA